MASSDEAAHAASETILSIPLISSQGADAAVAAEAATRAAPLPSAPAAPTPQATSLVAAVLIPIVGPQEVRPSSPGLRPLSSQTAGRTRHSRRSSVKEVKHPRRVDHVGDREPGAEYDSGQERKDDGHVERLEQVTNDEHRRHSRGDERSRGHNGTRRGPGQPANAVTAGAARSNGRSNPDDEARNRHHRQGRRKAHACHAILLALDGTDGRFRGGETSADGDRTEASLKADRGDPADDRELFVTVAGGLEHEAGMEPRFRRLSAACLYAAGGRYRPEGSRAGPGWVQVRSRGNRL